MPAPKSFEVSAVRWYANTLLAVMAATWLLCFLGALSGLVEHPVRLMLAQSIGAAGAVFVWALLWKHTEELAR